MNEIYAATQVECWTSDVPGADTRALVTLRMRGDKGTGELLPIGDDPDSFKRGRHDTFHVTDQPLGPLRRARESARPPALACRRRGPHACP